MNNYFNPKRFGKYFIYDLKNARNNYLLSLIIMGLAPAIAYLALVLFDRIFGTDASSTGLQAQLISVIAVVIGVIVSFPVKVYGNITEKRSGTQWLMVPASSFEKWASMMVMILIILPFCTFGSYFLVDSLLSLTIPSYGPALFTQLSVWSDKILEASENLLSLNFAPAAYGNWCEYILIMTLGSIVFKKAKVGKTFLSVVVFTSLVSSITMALIGKWNFDDSDLLSIVQNASEDTITFKINLIINAIYLLFNGALMAACYFRIRTLKH